MTEQTETLLRVENLAKIFQSGEDRVTVFEGLNFELRPGELVALVGESGSGKTTLLHLLAALDTPSRGEIYFKSQKMGALRASEGAEYRSRQVGFVWQMHHLLPEFTAIENVMLPQLAAGADFEQARRRARELLAETGIEKLAERRAGEISGGEQQRVALARALANRPALLLADEPTGNLDHATAGLVMDLLERLHRAHGLTSVMATHSMELAQRASRTLRLENGRLTETVVPRF